MPGRIAISSATASSTPWKVMKRVSHSWMTPQWPASSSFTSISSASRRGAMGVGGPLTGASRASARLGAAAGGTTSVRWPTVAARTAGAPGRARSARPPPFPNRACPPPAPSRGLGRPPAPPAARRASLEDQLAHLLEPAQVVHVRLELGDEDDGLSDEPLQPRDAAPLPPGHAGLVLHQSKQPVDERRVHGGGGTGDRSPLGQGIGMDAVHDE